MVLNLCIGEVVAEISNLIGNGHVVRAANGHGHCPCARGVLVRVAHREVVGFLDNVRKVGDSGLVVNEWF